MRIKRLISLFMEVIKLPFIKVNLWDSLETYQAFNKPHPRYFFIRNKSLGVAMIPITGDGEAYLSSINGKNSAAYYARKAERKGYICKEIDPNSYLEDIYLINTSKEYRQGRQMDQSYRDRLNNFEKKPNYKYFGVLNEEGKVLAYAWVPMCGEVWILGTLLGHADYLNDGIMYLLVTSIVLAMFASPEEERPKYLMYDTFFGAKEGLRMFKNKLGFKPYRVKWKI